MCHTVPGLSLGEQNLLLCETAQVAKSCLPPAMSHRALAEAGAGAGLPVPQEPPALAHTAASPGGNPLSAPVPALPVPKGCHTPVLGAFLLIMETDTKTKQPLFCSLASVAPTAFSSAPSFCSVYPKPLHRSCFYPFSGREGRNETDPGPTECWWYLSFLSQTMG